MMRTTTVLLACVLMGLCGAGIGAAEQIKPSQEWNGKIRDEGLRKAAPKNGFLTDAKAWKNLWKAWRGKEELAKVDFKKNLVLVATAGGPNIPFGTVALDKGNLTMGVGATKIGGPGFGYRIVVVSRKGVKKVFGKPLAKD